MAEKRSALVVATSEYEDARLTPLGGPGEDAEALQTVLSNAEIGGFDVQLALNAPHDELRTTLEGFFSDRGRDDLLLVHFSGHGLKDDDGQLYLAATDTRIDRLMSTGVEAGWVNRLMTRCRSEKIALFLDCCFGGAFTTGLARRAGVDTAGVKETFTGTGRFVITASDAMQYSFESGQRVDDATPQPSPFTSALVEGLRSGEADRNEDGFVSINELFDYLEDRVRQLSPAQTPTKSAFNQVGDWVIASSTRAPTIRILPASLQTQLKSEDALDRFAALIDLQDLIRGSDPRVADAAMKALEKLTGDDSKRVAAAAVRLFGEVPAERATVPVPSTPLSESSLPDVIKDALATKPPPDETRAAEIASGAEAPPTTSVRPEPPARRPDEISRPVVKAEPMVLSSQVLSPQVLSSQVLSSQPGSQPASRPVVASAAASHPPVSSADAAGAAVPTTVPSVAAEAKPHPGALWGPTTGASAPTATPRPSQAKDHPILWSGRRAAARAALGTWVGFAMFVALLGYADEIQELGSLAVISIAAIVVATIVSIAERLVSAVRIPEGLVFRLVGGNRWIASGIVGGIVGLVADGIFQGYLEHIPGSGVFSFAAGFLLAEALVGRRFGRKPSAGVRPA